MESLAGLIGAARESLWRWAPFSESCWWEPPDRADLGCFGTGYNSWGVQTNQKYLGAMAVLATDEGASGSAAFPREKALERALRSLRFSLASHHTGEYRCSDGTRWGRTWISALGVERMMHGVDAIEPRLTDRDRERLRAMIVDEADWQLNVAVMAGLWAKDGRNKPESNIWNGAVCARAALYWPDHPHAADWIERANLYFLNGISVPADAQDPTVVAGKPVKDWHRGANFFPNYALDHHGYLNVGYMVICLSNIAMLHYAFVLRGKEPPPALYHRAKDLWALVRRLVFADGRLARIGGDTRIRYCYCQDYLLPTLVFAADHWKDPHALGLLEGAIGLARREQETNPDGAFLSGRMAEMRRQSPYYFTRLEADKAVALSMALHWLDRRRIEPSKAGQDYESSVAGGWEEPEHGAAFHRSPTRLASWSWRASEPPQGLCLPPDDGGLAEWRENLAGGFKALGQRGGRRLLSCSLQSFDGGFVTAGEVAEGTDVSMPEGWQSDWSARRRIVFAALPDGHTAVRMERGTLAPRRVYIESWEGVKIEIPNDLFNGRVRRYFSAGGALHLQAHEGETERLDLESSWVNVEDRIGLIGIYGAETWTLLRRGRRIGGHAFGNVLTDALCYGVRGEPCDVSGPLVFLDNACAILSSADAERTRKSVEGKAARRLACAPDGDRGDPEACRAVLVRGFDGCEYLLAANMGEKEERVRIEAPKGAWRDLAGGEPQNAKAALTLELPVGQGRLLVRVQDA